MSAELRAWTLVERVVCFEIFDSTGRHVARLDKPLNLTIQGRVQADAHVATAAPEMLALLERYRKETPLGHQPHMIAHEADQVIAKARGRA